MRRRFSYGVSFVCVFQKYKRLKPVRSVCAVHPVGGLSYHSKTFTSRSAARRRR